MLVDTASGHIFGQDMKKTPPDDDHMEVRLDARTLSRRKRASWGSGSGTVSRSTARGSDQRLCPLAPFDDKACVANIVRRSKL